MPTSTTESSPGSGSTTASPSTATMSAPEVMIGWIAAQTDYIHLGTAITSLPTTKEQPVRIAERAAMLDRFCEGRFEFGAGRSAGSHEVATFNSTLTSDTKSERGLIGSQSRRRVVIPALVRFAHGPLEPRPRPLERARIDRRPIASQGGH
ncbi:MAG: LLM class flavin-dependent oxidoreductase, partial [Acidimicrobiaceae bacterium]|nr:LLM class flavin-dependent oxidoreductase [Acidimicrobiaceae bacterium]